MNKKDISNFYSFTYDCKKIELLRLRAAVVTPWWQQTSKLKEETKNEEKKNSMIKKAHRRIER